MLYVCLCVSLDTCTRKTPCYCFPATSLLRQFDTQAVSLAACAPTSHPNCIWDHSEITDIKRPGSKIYVTRHREVPTIFSGAAQVTESCPHPAGCTYLSRAQLTNHICVCISYISHEHRRSFFPTPRKRRASIPIQEPAF